MKLFFYLPILASITICLICCQSSNHQKDIQEVSSISFKESKFKDIPEYATYTNVPYRREIPLERILPNFIPKNIPGLRYSHPEKLEDTLKTYIDHKERIYCTTSSGDYHFNDNHLESIVVIIWVHEHLASIASMYKFARTPCFTDKYQTYKGYKYLIEDGTVTFCVPEFALVSIGSRGFNKSQKQRDEIVTTRFKEIVDLIDLGKLSKAVQ